MPELSPTFLLHNPALVKPVAPWCRPLDNLELGVLLLAQPWIAGEGWRRAELERRLARLAGELPLGPVYFQRVNRAAASLEESGALEGAGSGRTRRFLVTPEGFVALILNLRVLSADPTVDGREFELKRALVAMWNVLVDRLMELPEELFVDERSERFLHRVETVTIWGRRVITEELVRQAMDVRELIEAQRARVLDLRAAASSRLETMTAPAHAADELDLTELVTGGLGAAGPFLKAAETREVIQSLAIRTLPRLELRARLHRYDAYLGYLDELVTLYARQSKVADLELFRQRIEGRGR